MESIGKCFPCFFFYFFCSRCFRREGNRTLYTYSRVTKMFGGLFSVFFSTLGGTLHPFSYAMLVNEHVFGDASLGSSE